MIKELTQKQKDQLPVWRDKWVEIGLSCEPLDLEKAKAAVNLAYKAAGLEPPKEFIVFDSPLGAAIGASLIKEKASVKDSVRDSVWDSVRASVWDSVRDSVGASVRASVWDSVGASVGASVKDSVRDSVWDSVRDSVGASVRDSVWAQAYGAHDAGRLSFYDYFRVNCGLDVCAPLEGLIELAKNCGWWSPYKNVAVLQHRHCELHRDEEGRLHNEDGPSVRYRDGFCLHSWHGTTIPAEWIEKSPPLPQDSLRWENVEQRRAACEIIGWDIILKELNAKEINKDSNPEIGTLVEVDLPDSGKERFLQVRCGTGRDFALPVPPEMKTAAQANAWSYGLDSINVEVRT